MFEFTNGNTPRRGFLGTLAATAAAGLASLTPLRLEAQPRGRSPVGMDAAFETWLNRITGKHKMIFDAPEVNGGMPVIWPRVWSSSSSVTSRDARIDRQHTPIHAGICQQYVTRSGLASLSWGTPTR